MKRELELKFKLTNEAFFVDTLRQKGISLSLPVTQRDTVFFRKGKGYPDLPKGEPVMRIREQSNTASTALKKYQNGITDRLEVECEISDPVIFQKYLELLDIFPLVIVQKQRQNARYKDAWINLDHIDGLGAFAEVEILSEDSTADADTRKLYAIAKELGLDMDALIDVPYDQMLFYKMEGTDADPERNGPAH